jgi:hypothetical protein
MVGGKGVIIRIDEELKLLQNGKNCEKDPQGFWIVRVSRPKTQRDPSVTDYREYFLPPRNQSPQCLN